MKTLSLHWLIREEPSHYVAHYVIDASVAIKWVLAEEQADRAREIARKAVLKQLRLSIPSLFWYEIANVLRYNRRQRESTNPWQLFLSIPMETVGFRPSAYPEIEALARTYDLSAYDAGYVFLAQSLGVPLLTADRQLRNRCANLRFVWELEE